MTNQAPAVKWSRSALSGVVASSGDIFSDHVSCRVSTEGAQGNDRYRAAFWIYDARHGTIGNGPDCEWFETQREAKAYAADLLSTFAAMTVKAEAAERARKVRFYEAFPGDQARVRYDVAKRTAEARRMARLDDEYARLNAATA